MKTVRKHGAPHAYTRWRASVRGSVDEDYRRLRNPLKAEVLESLLKDQGWLCAYTMKGIEKADSHIEHIKPETLCRAEAVGSDLDYDNYVACFPEYGMSKRYRYGAQLKDDWWENNGQMFVSPLHPACQQRFRFSLSGTVSAVRNQECAETTIKILGLDHPTLIDERKLAIDQYIFGENGDDPLTPAQAKRAKNDVIKLRPNGRFHAFCIALMHAVEEYERSLARNTRRRKFAKKRPRNVK